MRMKCIALAIAIAGCEGAGQRILEDVPPDAGVSVISSPLVLDASLIVKLKFSYSVDWDGVLSWGPAVGNANAVRQVLPVKDMVCPSIWVLACQDYNCSQVEAFYSNVAPSSREIVRMTHYPWTLQYRSCSYEVHANGAATGAGIPITSGTSYVSVGYRCPSDAYSTSGDSGIASVPIHTVVSGSLRTADFGTMPGPFGNKAGWLTRGKACSQLSMTDPAWTSPLDLQMKWCEAVACNTCACLPGSTFEVDSVW